VGEMARMCPVINKLEILAAPALSENDLQKLEGVVIQENENPLQIEVAERFSITIHTTSNEQFNKQWCDLTMSAGLLNKISKSKSYSESKELEFILKENKMPGLPVECMDMPGIESAKEEKWNDLVKLQDLKGIIHNHSTYSDGIHTLEEMSVFVRRPGLSILCDM
jgi:DNA polymerase (family 10)